MNLPKSLSRNLALSVVFAALVAGCGKKSPEDLVRDFDSLRKDANVVLVRTPIEPLIEFRIEEKFADKYDEVFRSLLLANKSMTKKRYVEHLHSPLRDFKILGAKTNPDGSVEVTVEEQIVDAFISLLPAEDIVKVMDESQKAAKENNKDRLYALSKLADELVLNFPKHLAEAKKAHVVTDKRTYIVRELDGELKIFAAETKSEAAEKKAAAEKEAAQQAISALKIVNQNIASYKETTYIRGLVKNAGNAILQGKQSLVVAAELLDDQGGPIAYDVGYILISKPLQPNANDDFIVMFKNANGLGWAGKYRLRLSTEDKSVVGSWENFLGSK